MVSYTLCFFLLTLSLGNANLLEMSQTLWSKFLNGGLSNIGSLDPLRIPLVKVDQSHGHTSYRMILSNVQIFGLNASTLESIHVARGSFKTNSSEQEAGYISYTDQNIIDSIRYRFHTTDQQLNMSDKASEKLEVKPIEQFRDSGSHNKNQNDGLLLRAHNSANEEQRKNYQNRQPARYQQYSNERYHNGENTAEIRNQYSNNKQYNERANDRSNSHDYHHQENYHHYQYQTPKHTDYYSTTSHPNVHNRDNGDRAVHLVYAHQQMNINNQNKFRSYGEQPSDQQKQRETINVSINDGNYRNQNSRSNSNRHETSHSHTEPCFNHDHKSSRLEHQPGFVDIVYTRRQFQEGPHLSKLTTGEKENETTYSLEDVLRDLENHRRFIIHNFTEEELLLKKNDQMRTALESKRIHDLIRYAREFQEKHGYFEEGMELKYHYGNGSNSKILDVKRTKRAHVERDNEDDIVHVVAKIHVPLLKVKADCNLMGTVEKTVLRGNGQFNGEFTELIGYFTIELRKIGDSSLMVRATRAKLVAKSKNINLQGMNENGPVKEILTQGLMAAEAVAAMLVDDLTTKVLNETTNDAIIFKMYKDLPNN